MKKSRIIVLAFVFLWSAVPAFSAPKPVPSILCLEWDSYSDNIRLILKSEGKIEGVEYFRATGSHVADSRASVIKGSAHRSGRKVLHLSLTGGFDDDGPGSGGGMFQSSHDVRYNLAREKGAVSWLYLWVGTAGGTNLTDTLKAVDCSSLPKPSY